MIEKYIRAICYWTIVIAICLMTTCHTIGQIEDHLQNIEKNLR